MHCDNTNAELESLVQLLKEKDLKKRPSSLQKVLAHPFFLEKISDAEIASRLANLMNSI